MRGTLVVVAVGNSGNASRDNFGGAAFVFAPGPGTDVGPRMTGVDDDGAVTDDDAQGVLC